MNTSGIYFANKGITRRLGCPNLWPVKTADFDRAPRSVFEASPLIVFIEPKQRSDWSNKTIKHNEAVFSVFDAADIRYVPHWSGEGERFSGRCVLHATYIGKSLSIHLNIDFADGFDAAGIDYRWHSRTAAMTKVREAFELYKKYFPEDHENIVG